MGIRYRTNFVWAKDRAGTGYWARNQHEHLLVGVMGGPAPAPGTHWPSVIEAPVGEHSAKREAFAEMIERLFPTPPRIELFARGAARLGGGMRQRDPRADDRVRPGDPGYGAATTFYEFFAGTGMARAKLGADAGQPNGGVTSRSRPSSDQSVDARRIRAGRPLRHKDSLR